jgi:hypothetical protein
MAFSFDRHLPDSRPREELISLKYNKNIVLGFNISFDGHLTGTSRELEKSLNIDKL